jgi:hypothetical protein
MKRPLLILLLFCILSQFSEAQLWKLKRFEASAGLGPTFFFGDVGGYSNGENILGLKDVTFKQTRINFDLSVKYRLTQAINARFSFSYGLLNATDIRGSNEGREYEASMNYFQPALIGEYYIIKNKSENSYIFVSSGRRFFRTLFSSLDFYAFTGIGGMGYTVEGNEALENNPKGFESGGFTAVLPLGVGTTLIYSPYLNFGLEFGGRYTFTDYLDGYTSQYSSHNDVYYFLNFVVTYKLKTGRNGLPAFRR